MKIEVKQNNSEKQIFYPCVLKSDTMLVLAIGLGREPEHFKGTVIASNDISEIGEYSNNWNLNSFNLFDGSITLSND